MSNKVTPLSVDELTQIVSYSPTPSTLTAKEKALLDALNTDTGQAFADGVQDLSLDDICNKEESDVYTNLTQLLPETGLDNALKQRLESYIRQFLEKAAANQVSEDAKAKVRKILRDASLETASQQRSDTLSHEQMDQLLRTVDDQSSPLQPSPSLGEGGSVALDDLWFSQDPNSVDLSFLDELPDFQLRGEEEIAEDVMPAYFVNDEGEDMIESEELTSPQVQQSSHPQQTQPSQHTQTTQQSQNTSEAQVEEVSSDSWSQNLTRKQRLAFGRRAENAHQILEFKQAADLALANIVTSKTEEQTIDECLETYIAGLNNIDRDDPQDLSYQQATLVQWAYYFNINSDVGTPAFEKDLTRKLRICLMEELGEPEIDMDPVYESSTFAEHKDSFKARVYEQVMQKYAGEQLSDPDVRSKISKEITMAMMQERVNLIETQFEKTQKMKHAWESIKKCKSLIVPGVMTAALASSAVFGGTTAIPWLLGWGASAAWTGLPYLVTLLCQSPTFALTTGAIYSGAKLMQAVRKISLPPFFKKDAEGSEDAEGATTTANQSAMNVLRFGGRLAVGTGGKMSVHNVNSAQPGQSLKVRKLESQWEKQRKATLKASTQSIRTQMNDSQSRSACILNAIESAYSASNLGDIHNLKGDNVMPELAAFGSSTALFGLPSLTTHIGKKMFA
jgi:hypothetical protein